MRLFANDLQILLVKPAHWVDFAAHVTTQCKGKYQCNIFVFFSPQRQSSLFQHVLSPISNAALQALPLALSPQTLSVVTVQLARLRAALQVSFVTTLASAVAHKTNTNAPQGLTTNIERRRSTTPAAFFV